MVNCGSVPVIAVDDAVDVECTVVTGPEPYHPDETVEVEAPVTNQANKPVWVRVEAVANGSVVQNYRDNFFEVPTSVPNEFNFNFKPGDVGASWGDSIAIEFKINEVRGSEP